MNTLSELWLRVYVEAQRKRKKRRSKSDDLGAAELTWRPLWDAKITWSCGFEQRGMLERWVLVDFLNVPFVAEK